MTSEMNSGYFITLEGGEGAGKTTLLRQLVNFFQHQGYEVVATREPGGTFLGETIRDWLLQERNVSICSQAELLLFLADRAQHIEEKIIPALQEGKVVLCDRFNDSTIAYQGAARGLGMQHVQQLCRMVCQSLVPHCTLFLNVSPEIGLSRSKKSDKTHAPQGKLDRIESETIDFHRKIQKALEDLAKSEPSRIYTIDANQSQEIVYEQAVSALQQCIPSQTE